MPIQEMTCALEICLMHTGSLWAEWHHSLQIIEPRKECASAVMHRHAEGHRAWTSITNFSKTRTEMPRQRDMERGQKKMTVDPEGGAYLCGARRKKYTSTLPDSCGPWIAPCPRLCAAWCNLGRPPRGSVIGGQSFHTWGE